MLLEHSEHLVVTGEGIAAGRTTVALMLGPSYLSVGFVEGGEALTEYGPAARFRMDLT